MTEQPDWLQPAIADWPGEITHIREKAAVASLVSERAQDGQSIGFGSGTTSYLVMYALWDRLRKDLSRVTAVPTSYEIELACARLRIPTRSTLSGPPDWSFDGADEVDRRGHLIKGRGGALVREKIMIAMSPQTVIAVDFSKLVPALGTRFPVPVEVIPAALDHVSPHLRELGASDVYLRQGVSKDGPTITEHGNFLVDARFTEIGPDLETRLKAITGVVDSGLVQRAGIEVVSDAREGPHD